MSAKRKTDSRLLENADLREWPWLLARVPAVGRLARGWLVGRRRYGRGACPVRDEPYTVPAGTGSLPDGAGGAPFRAYGSPHS